jgi:hypothetical protein
LLCEPRPLQKSEAQLTKSVYIFMNEYSVLWKKSAFSKEQKIVGGRSVRMYAQRKREKEKRRELRRRQRP